MPEGTEGLEDAMVDSVANSNLKSVAEMGVLNSLAHQNRCNIIAETLMTKAVEHIHATSVPEGLGIAAAQRGDVAKLMTELLAAVKAGGNVPPVTP